MSNTSDVKPATGNRRVEQGLQSRARLVDSARALFQRDGYAATSTEALLAATGLTRGALYHHFRDKKALFLAVCEAEHADLSRAIDAATQGLADPMAQLLAGSLAWIDAVSQPGPRQVLLLDAPSVLGADEWAALDDRHGYRQLRAVVGDFLAGRPGMTDTAIDARAAVLNGAINELAHWLARSDAPGARAAAEDALRKLFAGVLG
ncbi:MAG: TetR/AcrR family transcriptional regulator [Ramlibacter sp.]